MDERKGSLNTVLSDIAQIASGLPRGTVEAAVERHGQAHRAKLKTSTSLDVPALEERDNSRPRLVDVPALQEKLDKLADELKTFAAKHNYPLSKTPFHPQR